MCLCVYIYTIYPKTQARREPDYQLQENSELFAQFHQPMELRNRHPLLFWNQKYQKTQVANLKASSIAVVPPIPEL